MGLARIPILVMACGVFAACGPTYLVYNGGMVKERRDLPVTALELEPTEAMIAFSSDYASPEENAKGGGPTNRVETALPARLKPHPFVAVSTSTGPQRVASGGAASASGVQSHVRSRADCRQAQGVSGEDGMKLLSGVSQEASVGGARAVALGGHSSGQGRADGLGVARATTAMAAAGRRSSAEDAQGLADASSIAEQHLTGQPSSASAPAGVLANSHAGAGKLFTGPDLLAQPRDSQVASGRLDNLVSKDVSDARETHDVLVVEAVEANANAGAAAAHMQMLAARAIDDSAAPRLGARREAATEVGGIEFAAAAESSQAVAAHKFFQSSVVLGAVEIPRTAVTSESVAERLAAENLQDLGTRALVAQMSRTGTAMTVALPSEPFSYQALQGAASPANAQGLHAIYKVSPAGLDVVKEARLITGLELQRLLKTGILKSQPPSNAVIRYRIFLFNPTESAAAQVILMDKLDDALVLLSDSVYTSSEASKAKYDARTGALEVALPRLESREYFMVEFYCEARPD